MLNCKQLGRGHPTPSLKWDCHRGFPSPKRALEWSWSREEFGVPRLCPAELCCSGIRRSRWLGMFSELIVNIPDIHWDSAERQNPAGKGRGSRWRDGGRSCSTLCWAGPCLAGDSRVPEPCGVPDASPAQEDGECSHPGITSPGAALTGCCYQEGRTLLQAALTPS